VPTIRWRFAPAPDGVYAAGADITAELRAQAELQDFAYIASHDLSEPLRMVTSYLELLQRRYGEQLDDTADEFIGYAVGGAKRMGALIDGLLSFSRVGTHELRIAHADLADVVRHVLAGQERAVADAGAQISVAETLPAVRADAVLLGKALGELVANALRFGGKAVAIEAAEDGDGLLIEVADDGIGIAEAHHERVFKPFTRLHGRDEYEGTGIGLAVCRRIAERHGGRTTLRSAEGEGSRFGVWLPR
jgi:light-regulated signal transduction histidine kinase (bacteriophytochrome)